MTPHRLRRSIKFSKQLFFDIVFASLSLALILGVSVLTIHRHPVPKLVVAGPAAMQGNVTH